MDAVISKIVEHSDEIRGSHIPSDVSEELKKRIADSIITSYGARDAPPVKIEKKVFLPMAGKLSSRVYFGAGKATPDIAAFINGSMTRYLDYNDTYLSREALHPSDNIPPLIAVADAMDYDGKAVLEAASMAYDVVGSLADAVSIRDRGWDHVTYISISAASGLANLMGLDDRKFENAISLSLNNSISMRQTRAGELSMWKGCTAADASRNAVFGALLASEGFTGPSPVFTGEMGFFRQVSGEFSPDLGFGKVLHTMIKNFPVEYHAMSAAEVALNLRNKIKGEIKHVDVETFQVAYSIIIKDPEKLRPKTRETADHSMPYIVAYTLLNGAPTPESYRDELLHDSRILNLIDRSTYRVTDRFNSMYPDYLPVRITVETDKGTFTEEMDAPKGHYRKPYTWDDLKAKGERVMGAENSAILMEFMKSFQKHGIRELMEVISDVSFKR
ncbi:MAG: MmgE/PrpD family protein [Thermoplasmataceae archaeon]